MAGNDTSRLRQCLSSNRHAAEPWWSNHQQVGERLDSQSGREVVLHEVVALHASDIARKGHLFLSIRDAHSADTFRDVRAVCLPSADLGVGARCSALTIEVGLRVHHSTGCAAASSIVNLRVAGETIGSVLSCTYAFICEAACDHAIFGATYVQLWIVVAPAVVLWLPRNIQI